MSSRKGRRHSFTSYPKFEWQRNESRLKIIPSCQHLYVKLFLVGVLIITMTPVCAFSPLSNAVVNQRLVLKSTKDTFKIKATSGVTGIPSKNDSEFNVNVERNENIDSTINKDIEIDPLLIMALQQQPSSQAFFSNGMNLSHASAGIKVWRSCLTKGRYPIHTDFTADKNSIAIVWPIEPFYSKVVDVMQSLQLPRFALRHPETVSAVLLTLIKLTLEFVHDVHDKTNQINEEEEDDDDYYGEYDLFTDYSYEEDDTNDDLTDEETTTIESSLLSEEEMNQIATEIANSFQQKWEDVVNGISILDRLFGYDHGMLDVHLQDDDDSDGMGGATSGFGIEDGLWKHTGWKQIPTLQKQITSMQELKDLMNSIGRRPTAENSNEVQKFAPRKLQKDGALGAQFDPLRRESVSGITLSGSLTEMLPSEAVLLRGSSSSGALRRLFMAKKAESKLLSYQMSGWTDVPSVPLTKPLYMKRMPSAPGGPIIVCLDTSWSMSGMREQLSKAVVLACVTMAHKQNRDCQVVAFSTERGVMEAGIITPDGNGIKRLLDFLSHSFGGGTDVTGALKFAIETLDSDVMSAADILMISDGEIPDPPVSQKIMDALDHLKLSKGVEIHGLLVGKKESKPLSRLSTHTHDFLLDYDTHASMVNERIGSKSALYASSSRLFFQKATNKQYGFSRRYNNLNRNKNLSLNAKRKNKRANKWGDADDDYDSDVFYDSQYGEESFEDENDDIGTSDFSNEVIEVTKSLKTVAEESLVAATWKPESLIIEREAEGSCWTYVKQLEAAIKSVSEGLVERDEEARLVVLAMLSTEHILLLGTPGTGKSILGRRLSNLCDGFFFQRLLTRFSTPEELFGPLSLKSLENDEYRRCTDGFLPTASIAFLDEIFKANSAILNTLLTILNERKFDNAGGQENCPIRCVVGASNELPESDELVALYDRFLLRKEVLRVSDEGLVNLLTMANPGCNIQNEEECDVNFIEEIDNIIADLSNSANSVHLSVAISELIRDLRTFMREEHNVDISDRRLVKAARLLKLSAASHGRLVVDPIDCLLLQHCMWNVPEQKNLVRDWLWENITPGEQINHFRLLLDTLRGEVSEVIRKTSGDVTGEFGARSEDIAVVNSLRNETTRIKSALQKQHSEVARHIELLNDAEQFIWLDPNEMKSVRQLLLPRAEKALKELYKALVDCSSLDLSLGTSGDAPSNDLRLSVIQTLWQEGYTVEVEFSEEEMNMGMKEAKNKYDLETFRKWKRAKKRLEKK